MPQNPIDSEEGENAPALQDRIRCQQSQASSSNDDYDQHPSGTLFTNYPPKHTLLSTLWYRRRTLPRTILLTVLKQSLGPGPHPKLSHFEAMKLAHPKLRQFLQLFQRKQGTLIYLGVNTGGGFDSIFSQYHQAFGFEANPEIHALLQAKYRSHRSVSMVHGAVTDFDGEIDFNISNNNGASSSIGMPRRDWSNQDVKMVSKIRVPAINLLRFLRERGINQIDMYVSDIQGMDLTVLRTLKPLLDAGKIACIRTETAKDKIGNIYEGLPDNSLRGFSELLGAKYELVAKGWGNLEPGVFNDVPEDWWEFDSMWKVRKPTL